jgi:hypothetical protein
MHLETVGASLSTSIQQRAGLLASLHMRDREDGRDAGHYTGEQADYNRRRSQVNCSADAPMASCQTKGSSRPDGARTFSIAFVTRTAPALRACPSLVSSPAFGVAPRPMTLNTYPPVRGLQERGF